VDTLAVTASRLRERADALLGELASDPGDPGAPVPDRLALIAEQLAESLLPAALRSGARPARLLVSGDGAVAQLPFGVLDLDPGPGYWPLAGAMEVARLRDAGAAEDAAPGGAALVVADPEISDRLRRRNPGLTELAATASDVDRVRSLVPDAAVLLHEDATLRRVRRAWEDAGLLYFACHTIRSSESPFRTYLPLSEGPEGSPLVTPYLDVGAIRAAKLQRCRLVVLASCASGAPYVSGRAWAPSLGDAFLDAGAGAVLQTLWRVRDVDAAGIPTRFLAAWVAGTCDPVAALAAARRAAITGADGRPRHPFGWAAYVLELRDY
jgi:CHAT domain-containing protein